MLLREERDEVHLAVAVQIERNDVDPARARVDHVRRAKSGCAAVTVRFSRIVICPLLRQPNAATVKSVLAVAVEVRPLDVGDARPAVEPERSELCHPAGRAAR